MDRLHEAGTARVFEAPKLRATKAALDGFSPVFSIAGNAQMARRPQPTGRPAVSSAPLRRRFDLLPHPKIRVEPGRGPAMLRQADAMGTVSIHRAPRPCKLHAAPRKGNTLRVSSRIDFRVPRAYWREPSLPAPGSSLVGHDRPYPILPENIARPPARLCGVEWNPPEPSWSGPAHEPNPSGLASHESPRPLVLPAPAYSLDAECRLASVAIRVQEPPVRYPHLSIAPAWMAKPTLCGSMARTSPLGQMHPGSPVKEYRKQ